MAPATRNSATPGIAGTGPPVTGSVPMIPSDSAPRTRPTAQLMRTAMSVTRGPTRSDSAPHTNDMRIATIVSSRRISTVVCSVKPTACTATTLITTITVLTASE